MSEQMSAIWHVAGAYPGVFIPETHNTVIHQKTDHSAYLQASPYVGPNGDPRRRAAVGVGALVRAGRCDEEHNAYTQPAHPLSNIHAAEANVVLL